jgi:hypothetical protein
LPAGKQGAAEIETEWASQRWETSAGRLLRVLIARKELKDEAPNFEEG